MAPLVLAYWVLCCFPGHALAKRAGWIEPEHSLLSRIALSYLALFAVVAVLAGAAYLGHLPLWTLGTVMVLLIVLGVADSLAAIWRSRASFRLSALDPVAVIGWSVLLADLWLGIVRGGHLGGDAAFHISRVRMLVDHGFNNWDPYIDGPFFSRVYHTNVYHALLAVAAQLARVEPIDAWLWTLPFAKLVVAAGTFHVAWTVLRQRALAWFATIYMIVQIAPLAYLLYPNKLSGFWLFPMVVSAMVALWEEERPPLTAASVLAAGVLVLAHVHPLYAVFACLTVAPIFGLRWLWRLSRRGPTRAPLFAMLALLFCMPALLVTKLAPTVPADTKVQPPPAVTLDAGAQAVLHQRSKAVQPGAQKGFAYYGKHGFALDPARYLKPVAWVPFAALLLGLFSTRRRAFMALGSISLLTSLVLYVPWLCTAVTHALGGEEWVISRYGAMRSACFDAVCPWVLGLFVPRVLAWRPVTALAALGMIAWGFTDSVDEPGSQRDPYYQHWNHWNSTLRRSEQYAREAKFLRKNVKPGRVVLVPYYPGTMLVAQYDLHLLAIPPSTGSPGIPGMALRRAHQNALLREGLSMAERDALLRYYHVRYLYVDRAHAPRVAQLYRGRIKRTVRGPLTLFEIALPRPRP